MAQVGHFEIDRIEFFRAYPSLTSHILFYSNGLPIGLLTV